MNRRPQLRWSMPADAAGPVYGPVRAISAFLQDGASAAPVAGEAPPPTVAAITAAAVAPSATASPVLLFMSSSLRGLPDCDGASASLFVLVRAARRAGRRIEDAEDPHRPRARVLDAVGLFRSEVEAGAGPERRPRPMHVRHPPPLAAVPPLA